MLYIYHCDPCEGGRLRVIETDEAFEVCGRCGRPLKLVEQWGSTGHYAPGASDDGSDRHPDSVEGGRDA